MINEMIKDELVRLQCPSKWFTTIETVLENTAGVEFEFDEREPGIEILTILRFLNDKDHPEHMRMMFSRKLATLDVFHYRAVKKTGVGPVLWNPLEQSLEEFKQNADELHLYYDEQPFPPNDFVRAWFNYNLGNE